jgi:hypothetical protein
MEPGHSRRPAPRNISFFCCLAPLALHLSQWHTVLGTTLAVLRRALQEEICAVNRSVLPGVLGLAQAGPSRARACTTEFGHSLTLGGFILGGLCHFVTR